MNRFLFLLCLSIYSVTTLASVSIQSTLSGSEAVCKDFNIQISNEISSSDFGLLKQAIDRIQKSSTDAPCDAGKIVVWLDSSGGDPTAAIEMGRLLRKNEAHVVVRPSRRCLSSCVLIFAGGVIRIADEGQIGIHRPYFSNLPVGLSTVEIRNRREKLNAEILEYFREIDVSPALLERMLGIAPERIEVLTYAELERYRLSFEDTTYNEKRTAKEAYEFGLSSQEYRVRSARVENACLSFALTDNDKWSVCRLKIILNLSEEEARRRMRLKLRCYENRGTTRQDMKAIQSCMRNVNTIGKLK
jgi:hypothetical protein